MITFSGSRGLRKLSHVLRSLVSRTLELENARIGEIGVRLSGDSELRALNRRWRGIDRATDVLSYPYADFGVEHVVSGDVIISMERALEQARTHRVSVGRELARLAIHGTLHLAGHDHHRAGERARMRRSESRALRETKTSIRALDSAWGRGRLEARPPERGIRRSR